MKPLIASKTLIYIEDQMRQVPGFQAYRSQPAIATRLIWDPKISNTMDLFLAKPKDNERRTMARLIASGDLIPVMNNTKWRELLAELRAGDAFKPQFRMHDVLAPDGYVSSWDGELHYHIHPVETIEWLELRSTSPSWLLSCLTKHSIPFSIENGIARVWGYTRPGRQPIWDVA